MPLLVQVAICLFLFLSNLSYANPFRVHVEIFFDRVPIRPFVGVYGSRDIPCFIEAEYRPLMVTRTDIDELHRSASCSEKRHVQALNGTGWPVWFDGDVGCHALKHECFQDTGKGVWRNNKSWGIS